MVKASFVAPLPKLVAEPSVREWTLPIVHKESQVAARRGADDPLQCRQHGQRQLLRVAVAALVLRKGQLAVPNVLATKAGYIRTPLPREKEERKRKPRLAPDRVTLLELLYLLPTPCVESG